MMYYSAGRISGVVIDVSMECISCLALAGGFALSETLLQLPLELGAVACKTMLDAANPKSNVREKDADVAVKASRVEFVDTVAKLVAQVVKNAPIDLALDLINGITVAGSGLVQWIKSTNPGDIQKLHDEMFAAIGKTLPIPEAAWTPETITEGHLTETVGLKIIIPAEFKYSSWIGGARLAGLFAVEWGWSCADGVVTAAETQAKQHRCGLSPELCEMSLATRITTGSNSRYWDLMEERKCTSLDKPFFGKEADFIGSNVHMKDGKSCEHGITAQKELEAWCAAEAQTQRKNPVKHFMKDHKAGPFWLPHWSSPPALRVPTDAEKKAADAPVEAAVEVKEVSTLLLSFCC
jgi:hypothetical protein